MCAKRLEGARAGGQWGPGPGGHQMSASRRAGALLISSPRQPRVGEALAKGVSDPSLPLSGGRRGVESSEGTHLFVHFGVLCVRHGRYARPVYDCLRRTRQPDHVTLPEARRTFALAGMRTLQWPSLKLKLFNQAHSRGCSADPYQYQYRDPRTRRF